MGKGTMDKRLSEVETIHCRSTRPIEFTVNQGKYLLLSNPYSFTGYPFVFDSDIPLLYYLKI